jgi:hypothetical protein
VDQWKRRREEGGEVEDNEVVEVEKEEGRRSISGRG